MPDFAPPARPSNPFAAPPFAPLLPHAPGPAPRLLGAGGNPAGAAELGAQFAEGSSTPASAAHAKLLEEAKLFSTDMVTKPTADLDPKVAAEQRITHARKVLLALEALGLTPDQARAQSGMDDRILKEVGRQQELVDTLMSQRSKLTAAQLEAAKVAGEQRARMREKPGSVSKAEHDALIEKLGGQKALDEFPAETRLLLHGFSPDEIADHFTARDKDADVLVDPNDPANRTDARGSGELSRYADGDRNDNARGLDKGTVRRPMTPAEADQAIDINCALDESWHADNAFGKLIPDNTVGNLLAGRDTYRDEQGNAKGHSAIALTGDLAERLCTSLSRRRDGTHPSASDQIAEAGVDYARSPFVQRNAERRLVPKKNPDGTDAAVHRLEGTITKELEDNAEVQVGRGVMARAKMRSKELDAHKTDPTHPYIPKMLRRDDTSADHMPGLNERIRETPVDPRTGLGFSATESADMGVVPNQERKMTSPMGFDKLPDAQVTRSDMPGRPIMTAAPGGRTFSLTPGLPSQTAAAYDALKAQSLKRAAEVDAPPKAFADIHPAAQPSDKRNLRGH